MDSQDSVLDSAKSTEMNTSATKLLVAYSDSSDADTDKEEEIQIIDDRRSVHSFDSESDSESSSSSSSSESDVSDAILLPEDDGLEENGPKESNCKKGSNSHQLKTKGEIGLEDLPPIEDLKITVPKAEVQLVGHVLTIVDCLVTIQTLINLPALDLDTMLFFENGDSFGQVFDVFGPVSRPLYIVRFNSNSDILDKKISAKMPVYFAPKKEEYTTFVFNKTFIRTKGCDASWKDDEEPPNDRLEYSDDEKERSTKKEAKGNKNKEQDSPALNEQTKNWNKKNRTHNRGSKRNNMGQGGNYNQPPPSQLFQGGNYNQPPPSQLFQGGNYNQPPPSQLFQGGNYNQPPPSQLFAANVPQFLNQNIGMPRFPPYNQQQYCSTYPNQSSFHPVLLPPPPPPPHFLSTVKMPVSSGMINPSAFQLHPMASSPAAFINESSESSGAILPNPFRELSNRETPPVLNNAAPMFPPSGFMHQP